MDLVVGWDAGPPVRPVLGREWEFREGGGMIWGRDEYGEDRGSLRQPYLLLVEVCPRQEGKAWGELKP